MIANILDLAKSGNIPPNILLMKTVTAIALAALCVKVSMRYPVVL